MINLLAFPILSILLIIQTTIISRLNLVGGSADIIVLFLVALSLQERAKHAWVWIFLAAGLMIVVSAAPVSAVISSYAFLFLLTHIFRRRIWQVPLLAMFFSLTLVTIFYHFLIMLLLNIDSQIIRYLEGFYLVTLPSAFLNLLLSLPMYAIVTDFTVWAYPERENYE